MRKTKIIAIILVVIASFVFILLRNRSKIEEKIAKNVSLDPTVSVVQVGRQEISQELSLVGTVEANLDVMIVSETIGKVMEVKARVGDHVNAGSIIVLVDDELKLANFKTAEVNYEKSKKDLQRYEDLYKTKAVTENEIESARLACKAAEAQYLVAKRQYNDTRITSPIAGIIASRLVDRGSMVQPGMDIANVVDISRLKVKVSVAESDVFKLKPGDSVTVSTDIYPGVTFQAKIANISSKSDDSHTYPVEIDMENSEKYPLKAGMFARLIFPAVAKKNALVIPRESLLGSQRDPQVFVVEKNTARLRGITLGAETGSNLVVLNGLVEGETIIVSGQNNLIDGSAVIPVKR
jgi:RND family efflux transporter MFP subunit